jgi:hypothetical protein
VRHVVFRLIARSWRAGRFAAREATLQLQQQHPVG